MKKEKTSRFAIVIFVIILIVGSLVGEAGSDVGTALSSLMVVAVVAYFVIRVVKPRKASAKEKPEDPRMKSFTTPDAPCIVCENTGEDHLQRDKANRIRQLDEWLKIGLIEREEYKILKDRYQRDI